MGIVRRLIIRLLPAAGLAACETPPMDSGGRPNAPVAAAPSVPGARVNADTEAPDLGALGTAYAMPRGRCGMILYTQAAGRTVPIFRSLDDATALMQIEGDMTALQLTGARGEVRVSQSEQQAYIARMADGSKVEVEVEARWGLTFPGGSYVERALITLTGADGWRRVLPSAGIAGCKA